MTDSLTESEERYLHRDEHHGRTGKVQLTGFSGDVMKESAMAAISYIRANHEKLAVDSEFYKKKDIHVHVPEGSDA